MVKSIPNDQHTAARVAFSTVRRQGLGKVQAPSICPRYIGTSSGHDALCVCWAGVIWRLESSRVHIGGAGRLSASICNDPAAYDTPAAPSTQHPAGGFLMSIRRRLG